jgi:uncharacterized integral membrane protein
MEKPSVSSPPRDPQGQGAALRTPSRFSRAGRFIASHPVGVVHSLILALVTVVILQNLEPTSLDFLFWSIPEIPKLVILILAMFVGGALWEIIRRLLRR